MLPFSQLSPEDQQKRYRRLVSLPVLLLFAASSFYQNSPSISISITTAWIIATLFFFGVLTEREDYTKKDFFLDVSILIGINLLCIFFLSYPIAVFFVKYADNNFVDRINAFQSLIGYFEVFLIWFVFLKLQSRFSSKQQDWKKNIFTAKFRSK